MNNAISSRILTDVYYSLIEMAIIIRRYLPVRLMNRNVRFREADLGRVSMKLR